MVQRKILHYTNITEPHRRHISQHFYHYSSCFFKEIKGILSQDFSKLNSCFCYQKNEVKKSLLLLILKNFQRSKIITDIYRFTSGLSTVISSRSKLLLKIQKRPTQKIDFFQIAIA
jgi:hypothetical protein